MSRKSKKDKTDLIRAARENMILRARDNILTMACLVNPLYKINWHHQELARKLDAFVRGEIKYLMVFMPPRHGKSELVSRTLPAYIHGKYPDDEIMAASYNDSLAGDMCMDVQKIMDSSIYKEIFPNVTIPPPRGLYTNGVRNSEEHHINGHKGKYRGQGVGGSFTGKGANWVLIDDPIKGRETADSVAFRERLWNFWLNDLYSRLETNLENGREGQVLVTLTRWHEDDLAGRLLEKMKNDPKAIQWDIVEFPAIRVDMDNPDDPREIGEALWPLKYNIEKLNEIKASAGPRAWGSLYQQNPVPIGGAHFNDKMFEFGQVPSTYDYSFVTADTAYKDKQSSDYTVFSHWGVVGDQLYLHGIFRKQIKASEVEAEVEGFIRRAINYGFRAAWIEPKGHGIYLNQAWARKGLMIPSEDRISEFYKDRKFDKVERANNVITHLASRKVIINERISYKEELVSEALVFPKGKHDDFVDTLVDALKITYGTTVGILDVL